MKQVAVSLLVGIAVGILLFAPFVLADSNDQPQPNTEWCFYSRYDSLEHYESTVPPADSVFIEFNGRQVRVSVPCSAYVYP